MSDEPQRGGIPAASAANAIQMVRQTQQNHLYLSQMADTKASLLMGANFLIFTLAIGQGRGGSVAPMPLLVLGGFAFASAVLAILAVLPATGPRVGGPVNLLFFGSFVRFDREEYLRRMVEAAQTDESVFRTIAEDIYQNGTVLAQKKYRLLGYAYRTFLVGLTLSLVTFVVEVVTR